jgi:hypothetical protein
LYESANTYGGISFPFTFTQIPMITITTSSTGLGTCGIESFESDSSSALGRYYVLRPNSWSSSINYYMNANIKGRWK